MGLRHSGPRGHLTQKDRDLIRELWGTIPVQTLADSIGCSKQAVSQNAQSMGLSKLRERTGPMTRQDTKPSRPKKLFTSPYTAPTSDFIKPPTLAQLMAGR